MKIAILGTRGIPNGYGGFEQFAEYFSKYISSNKINISVYNPDYHFPNIKYFELIKKVYNESI